MGFDVRELPFEYSGFPGRLATPFLGGMAAALVGVAGKWGVDGGRLGPLLVLGVGAIALFVGARWLIERGVLAAPVMREPGVNLEATHPGGGDAPGVWLCAHIDSKSQPVPTLARSSGIVVEGIGYAWTLALTIAVMFGVTVDRYHWEFAAVVTLVGAIPVVLSMVGTRSPGALDNASGVATVIAAARQLAGQRGVGVLITDAEELGLAGARALARSRSGAVLNCDGVDDVGGIQVMFTGRRPRRLLDGITEASKATGIAHEAGRLIPGVLTDSVAFTDAGLESVTFSRGSWSTLVRIHTRRDDLAHLRGTGIAETAALIAETALTIQRKR